MGRVLHWWPAILLGLATIGSYGTAYYAIGALLPVIKEDTGWRGGILSGGYSLGVLLQGGVALICGFTLDRRGSRLVLWPALLAGTLFMLAASTAGSPWQFAVTWALGGAITGGGLFYNVSMPMTARLFPRRRAAAFSVLTLLGALASPIFYPLTAWFVDLWGWRAGLRGLIAVSFVCVAPAALFVRAPAAAPTSDSGAHASLGSALRSPPIYRALAVFALAGFANSAIILHQVGALEAAGLTLATASYFAGARGAFQIPGRLFLTPLVRRLGVRGAIGGCYVLTGSAALALLLAFAGAAPVACAVYFTVVGGIALGLLSPLNGLFQTEVYGDARLGALNGVSVIVGSIAAAAGAWCAGLLVDWTGSYAPMAAGIAATLALAVLGLVWQRAAMPPQPAMAAPAAGD